MNERRATPRSSKPLDMQQAELLEQAAQIIARMGQQRAAQALPRPGDIYGIVNRRSYGYDPLLRIFRLARAQELLPVVAAVTEDDPVQRLEQRALVLADTLALYDGDEAPAGRVAPMRQPGERRSDRSMWQREMVGLFAEAFTAGGVTHPSLRALSLLTLLDRSPRWFRQIGGSARRSYVLWAVANLTSLDFN